MAKQRVPPDGHRSAVAWVLLVVLACLPSVKALDACLARPWQSAPSLASQATMVALTSFDELQELVNAAEGPATFVLETAQPSLVASQPLHINKSDITIAASQQWLNFDGSSTSAAAPARLAVSCSSTAESLLQIDGVQGVRVLGLAISGCSSSAVQVSTARGVVLRGCQFTANSNANSGGAVDAQRSQLWIDSCSFQANSAGGGSGGAVWASFSQLLVSDSRFGANSAGASGGAVAMRGRSPDAAVSAAAAGGACWKDADAVLAGSSFTSNRAKLQGGAVAANGTHVILQGADASQNRARYGGVAYMGQTAQLTIKGNSTMTNNVAASSGGVVYAVSPGARVTLTGSSFSNNTAKILGGVVSAKEAASVRLDSCQFSNNTADLAAGVVYARDADMVASGCTFTANTAKRDGGALYCAGGCIWKLRSCTFRENQCGANGGAIFGWNVEASISSSSLDENSAGALGGGVAVANSTLELKSCKLGSNNAYGSDAAGGGLYSQGSKLNLTDCYMGGNVASWGGAIYITNSTMSLAGSGIANSSATGAGAAIYALRSGVAVVNTTLSYNDAQQHGGTMYCSDSTCSFVGCEILGDSAAQGGGCIWVGRGSLSLRRSQLAGCVSAGDDGGGVYAAGASSVSVSGCTFKGCSALKGSGGAMWLSGVHAVAIRGSLFARNQAMYGGSLYISNSTTSIGSSSVINSTATVGGGIAATLGSDLALFNSTAVAGNAAAVGGGLAVDSTHLTFSGPVTVSWNKALRPAIAATAVTASAAASAAVSASAVFGGQAVLRGLGGGLYAHNSKVLSTDLRLERNTADRVGAGGYLDRCGTRLVSSSIGRNQATEQAGGLKLLNPAQGSALLNVTVSNNWAGLKGGGLAIVGVDLASEVALVDTHLVNNTASGQAGGGLWLSGPLGLLMVGGEVSANTAGSAAAAAAAAASDGSASAASLQASGGGVLLEDCSWAALHGVDIFGNAALAGCGGGLALSGCGKFLLSGSTVLGNVAGSGGGLCALDMLSFLTLADSTISSNRVLLGGLWDSGAPSSAALSPTPEPHLHCGVAGTGGGMCISSLGEVLINGSTVSRNQARNGGAMALSLCSDGDKCSLGLVGTRFLNNTAVQGGGGAVYFSTAVSPYQVRCGEDYNTSSVASFARGTSFPSLASLLESAAFLHSSSGSNTTSSTSTGPAVPGSGPGSSGSSSGGAGDATSDPSSSGSTATTPPDTSNGGVSINEGVDTVNPTPPSSGTSSEEEILVSTPGSQGMPAEGTAPDGSVAGAAADTYTPDALSGDPATTTVSFDSGEERAGAQVSGMTPAAAAPPASPSVAADMQTTVVAGASQAESARAGDGVAAPTAPSGTSRASTPAAAADDGIDASTDGYIPPGGPSADPGMFTIASVPEVRPGLHAPANSSLAAFQARSAQVAAGLQQEQAKQQVRMAAHGSTGLHAAAMAAATAAGNARHRSRQHAAEAQLPGAQLVPDASLAASDATALAAVAGASAADRGEDAAGHMPDSMGADWGLADAAEGLRVIRRPQDRNSGPSAAGTAPGSSTREADALLAAAKSTAAAARAASSSISAARGHTAGAAAGPSGVQLVGGELQQRADSRPRLTEATARTLAVPVTLTVLQAAEKAGVHPKVTTAWQRVGTVSLGTLLDAGVVDATLLGDFWDAYPKPRSAAGAAHAAASKVAGWQQQFYANLAAVLTRAAAQSDRLSDAGAAGNGTAASRSGQAALPYACDTVQNPAACPVPKAPRAGDFASGGSHAAAAGPAFAAAAAAAGVVSVQQERGSSSSSLASSRGRRLAQVEEMVTAAEDAAGNMTFMSTEVVSVGAPAPVAAASSGFILQGSSQCGLFSHNQALGARAYGPVVTSRPAGLRVWGSAAANDSTSSIPVATGGQLQVQVSVVDVFGGIVTSGAADFIRIRATLSPPLGAAGSSRKSGELLAAASSMSAAAAADLISRGDSGREKDDNGVELSGLQQLSSSNGSLILSGLQLSGLPGTNTTLFIVASDPSLLPASLPITLTSCSAGYMQLPGQCQMCPVGTFSFTADEPLCSLCPVGASCNGTLLVPTAGYWASTPRSAQVHACLNPAACARDALRQQQLADWQATHYGRGAIVGKSKDSLVREMEQYMTDQCAAGYTGRMCGVCTQEPAATARNRVSHGMVGGACVACGERKTVIGTFVLVRLFDLVLWAVLTFLACKAATAWAQAISLNPGTAAATAGSLPPSTASGRNGSRGGPKGELVIATSAVAAAAAAEVPVSAVLHAHVTVFFDYLQMLSIISASAASYAWPRVLKTFMAAFAFVPLGTSRWVSAECLLPYTVTYRHSIVALLLTAALPLLYLMSSAAVWIFGLFRGHTHRAAMMALIVGTGLFYPLITMSALSVFSCHTLDDSKTALPGEQLSAVGSYWTLDPELQCYHGQHLQLTLGFGLPVVLLVVFAWPLLLASMLWDSRFRIRDQQLHPATRRRYLVRKTIKMCHQILGVMCGFIRPRLYLWPVVAEVRKLLLCVVVVLVAGSPAPVQLYVLWGLVASMLVLEWWLRPGATWPIVGLQLVGLGAVQGVIYLASAFTQVSLAGSAASFSALIIVLCTMVAVALILSLIAAFKANTWLTKALDFDKDGKVSRSDLYQSASKLLSFGVQHYKDDSASSDGKSWTGASTVGSGSSSSGFWKGAVLLFSKRRIVAAVPIDAASAQDSTDDSSAHDQAGAAGSPSPRGIRGRSPQLVANSLPIAHAAAAAAEAAAAGEGDHAVPTSSSIDMGMLAMLRQMNGAGSIQDAAALAAAHSSHAEGKQPQQYVAVDLGQFANSAALQRQRQQGQQQQDELVQSTNPVQRQRVSPRNRHHTGSNMGRANSVGAPGPNGGRMPLQAYMSVQQWLEQSADLGELTHGPRHPDIATVGPLDQSSHASPRLSPGSRATSMSRSRSLQASASTPAPQLAALRCSSGSLALQRAQMLAQFQQQHPMEPEDYAQQAVAASGSGLATVPSLSESERQRRRRLTGPAAAARAREAAAAAAAAGGADADEGADGAQAPPARHQPYYALWSNIASAITGPSGSVSSSTAGGGRPPTASAHNSSTRGSERHPPSTHTSSSRHGMTGAASSSVTRSSRGMHSSGFVTSSITSSNNSTRVRASPFAAAAVTAAAVRPSPFAAAVAAGAAPGAQAVASRAASAPDVHSAAAALAATAAGAPSVAKGRHSSYYSMWQAATAELSGGGADAAASTAAAPQQQQQQGPGMTAHSAATASPVVLEPRRHKQYIGMWAALADELGDGPSAVGAATPGPVVPSEVAAAFAAAMAMPAAGVAGSAVGSAAPAPPVVLEPRRHKQYIGMWAALADELGDGPSAVGAATPGPVVPSEVAAAFAAAMAAPAVGSVGSAAVSGAQQSHGRSGSGSCSSPPSSSQLASQIMAPQSPAPQQPQQHLPGRVRPSPFATMSAAAAVIGMTEQAGGAAGAVEARRQQQQRHRRRPGRRPRDSAGTCLGSDSE